MRRAEELEDDLAFLADTLHQAGADAIAVAEVAPVRAARGGIRFPRERPSICGRTAPSTAWRSGNC